MHSGPNAAEGVQDLGAAERLDSAERSILGKPAKHLGRRHQHLPATELLGQARQALGVDQHPAGRHRHEGGVDVHRVGVADRQLHVAPGIDPQVDPGVPVAEPHVAGFDRQRAPVGHRVPGVDREIQHDLDELRPVGENRAQRRRRLHLDPDVLADETTQQAAGLAQHVAKVEHRLVAEALDRLLPTMDKDLADPVAKQIKADGGEVFVNAKAVGWTARRLRKARKALLDAGLIEETHHGGKKLGDASLFRFG